VGLNVYLKVRFYDGKNFGPIFTLISTTTSQTDSMMPSIKLAKDGVVFVSYSFGKASSTRKQYMVKYVSQ
jgi:poly-D-alanine transfer protein DltD